MLLTCLQAARDAHTSLKLPHIVLRIIACSFTRPVSMTATISSYGDRCLCHVGSYDNFPLAFQEHVGRHPRCSTAVEKRAGEDVKIRN